MNNYIKGSTIKMLRESISMTQLELGNIIGVSDKTVSKWETEKGLPDISIIESLAKALKVSLTELFSGNCIINRNVSANMMRSKLYVCPVCKNVIHSIGECVVSCCGITLPALIPETDDDSHKILSKSIEDEYFIHINHPMTKDHYIAFIAYVSSDKFEIKKLYPEGNAEARLKCRGTGKIYAFCTKHGLFELKW